VDLTQLRARTDDELMPPRRRRGEDVPDAVHRSRVYLDELRARVATT
jgi:hypothetical protein